MRVFAAVWPPDDVLDHLDLALAAVRRSLPGDGTGPVRWSARETWHLTCAFYGELPDGSVPELASRLAAVAAGAVPYTVRLRGAGLFSHRTLWVGVGGDTAAQQSVARAAVAAGDAVGAWRDERPRDRAHVTVGRVRPGASSARGRRWGGPDRSRGDDGHAGAAPGRRRADDRRGAPDGFDPETLVAALAVYEGPAWIVDSLRLVASRPGEGRGGGPLYTPLEELTFGP